MTTAEVATRLRLSRSSVHRLDQELKPSRCQCGSRIYTEAAVAAFEAQLPAARAALSEARAARMRAIRDHYQPRRRHAPGNA